MKPLICLLFSLVNSGALLAQSPTVKVPVQVDGKSTKQTSTPIQIPVVIEAAPANSGGAPTKASSQINKKSNKSTSTPIKIPVQVEAVPVNPNEAPTKAPVQMNKSPKSTSAPIKVPVRITTYSDSSTAAMMRDTSYLNGLSGDYSFKNINRSSTFINVSDNPQINRTWAVPNEGVVTVQVRENKTLWIILPGNGEYELIPITPSFFELKGLPKAKVLYFIDPKERPFAFSFQYDRTELMNARKKSYKFNE